MLTIRALFSVSVSLVIEIVAVIIGVVSKSKTCQAATLSSPEFESNVKACDTDWEEIENVTSPDRLVEIVVTKSPLEGFSFIEASTYY